jgi:hypothetical protein
MKERKMDWRGHIEPPYETHVTLWKKKGCEGSKGIKHDID